jgi:hypothetical protein
MFLNFSDLIVEVNAVVRHFRHQRGKCVKINDKVRKVQKY